jgi:hypothetical protein
LFAGSLRVILDEGGANEGGNDTPPVTTGMRQHVAHEVDAAALPRGVQHFGNSRLDALMGVRDHQLDAAQAASGERAQELGPEGLGFRRADVHAEHLAPAVAVDSNGDDHRNRHNAPALPHFHVGRVDPQVGPVAFERAVRKAVTFSSISSHSRLTWLLEMPVMPMALTRSSTERGGDAVHIGLLHHCSERLLRQPARLQEGREVAAFSELGDAQLHRAGTRLKAPDSRP